MSYAARPLNPWSWLGWPALLCLLATWIVATPFSVFGLHLPEPIWVMVPVFAWPVIRPSILAPFVVLGLGLLLDAFWGAPMGLWALSLLIGYAAVLATRNIMSGQGRAVTWAWYGGVTALTMLAAYLFTMLDAKGAATIDSVFWQYLVTVLLYPFADRLIERFEDADVRFR